MEGDERVRCYSRMEKTTGGETTTRTTQYHPMIRHVSRKTSEELPSSRPRSTRGRCQHCLMATRQQINWIWRAVNFTYRVPP